MAIKILQIDLQNDITPQIGSYDNTGGVTPNNWRNDDGVYSLGPTNGQGTTPYYWFTPTQEVTDFDLCWEDYQDHEQTTEQYHLEIGDNAGNVVLSVFQQHGTYYIGPVNIRAPGYQIWHKILVEVRKASASSSTVTVYVDGKKVTTGTSNTLLTSAKIALLGHVPGSYRWQNAGQRLRYVTIYDRSYTSKGINLDGMMTTITALISKLIAKLSTVALTGSYNDLRDKPTISTVNDGTLTIQQNGTNVATFTANQSTNATANITVPTKTSDLTNDSGFITEDTTKIPLAGSNAISGSLIPATTDAYDLGGISYQWNNAYIKSLTINGVVCGDILTHNVSEFVGVTGNQTIAGVKLFKDTIIRNAGNFTAGEAPTAQTTCAVLKHTNNDGTHSANSILSYMFTTGETMCELTQIPCIGSTARTWFRTNTDGSYSIYSYTKNGSLGTNGYRWKDVQTEKINNLNPGALSLPSTNLINVASSITALDGSTINKFTPQVNGWLLINGTGTANDGFIYVVQGQIGMMCTNNSSYDRCAALIPVVAGVEVSITCKLSALTWANIAPCQGNV